MPTSKKTSSGEAPNEAPSRGNSRENPQVLPSDTETDESGSGNDGSDSGSENGQSDPTDVPENDKGFRLLRTQLNARIEELRRTRMSLAAAKNRHACDKRIHKSELAAEKLLKLQMQRKMKGELDVITADFKGRIGVINADLKKLRTHLNREQTLKQRDSICHSSVESHLKIAKIELVDLKQRVKELTSENNSLQKKCDTLEKTDKEHQVEMARWNLAQLQEKNRGCELRNETADIQADATIRAEQGRNASRLQLSEQRAILKRTRKAVEKQAKKEEQEAKLQWSSNAMRNVALANNGQFSIRGGGTHNQAVAASQFDSLSINSAGSTNSNHSDGPLYKLLRQQQAMIQQMNTRLDSVSAVTTPKKRKPTKKKVIDLVNDSQQTLTQMFSESEKKRAAMAEIPAGWRKLEEPNSNVTYYKHNKFELVATNKDDLHQMEANLVAREAEKVAEQTEKMAPMENNNGRESNIVTPARPSVKRPVPIERDSQMSCVTMDTAIKTVGKDVDTDNDTDMEEEAENINQSMPLL